MFRKWGCRLSSKVHDFTSHRLLARFPVPGLVSLLLSDLRPHRELLVTSWVCMPLLHRQVCAWCHVGLCCGQLMCLQHSSCTYSIILGYNCWSLPSFGGWHSVFPYHENWSSGGKLQVISCLGPLGPVSEVRDCLQEKGLTFHL